jgi:hypothetical protein
MSEIRAWALRCRRYDAHSTLWQQPCPPAQPRLKPNRSTSSWMSSPISQRMRSRPNQQREGLLYDTAVHAQAGAVLGAAAGDHGSDALVSDLPPVLVMVIAPVGVDRLRLLLRAARSATDRRDCRAHR